MQHYFTIILFFITLSIQGQDLATLEQLAQDSTRDSGIRVQALNTLSRHYYYKSISKAEAFNKQAIALIQSDSLRGRSLNIAALLNFNKGQYEQAIKNTVQAIQLATNLEDSIIFIDAYCNYAIIYSEKGYPNKALSYLLKANKLAERLSSYKYIGNCYVILGRTYLNINDLDQALFYYEKALQFFSKKEDVLQQTFLKAYMAEIQLYKFNTDTALIQAESILQQFQSLENKRGEAFIHQLLGKIQLYKNDFAKADKEYRIATKLYQTLGDQIGLAGIYLDQAKLFFKQEQKKPALAQLKKAIVIAKSVRARVLSMKLYREISDIYARMGDYRQALVNYRKYNVVKDSVQSRDKNTEIAELQVLHQTEKLAREKSELTKKNQEQKYELTLKEQELSIQQLQNAQNQYIIFVLIGGVLLILIITGLMMRQRMLQGRVREAELEQIALRSQMNPHFIFNSLNSIQSLIASGDNPAASIYLARFSRLMRSILNNSRQTYIPLQEEVNFLKNYLGLEQRRFKEAFDIDIELPDLEMLNYLMIPSFIVQPFVENAILHGLLRKETKGTLRIEFEEIDEYFLRCVVEDNGIGRSAALQYKKAKSDKSLGIEITKQRLAHLSMKQNVLQPMVTIIDLKDEQGKASGTRVEIILPVKYKTYD